MSFDLEAEMLPVLNSQLKSLLEELEYFSETDIKLKATEIPNSYRKIDMVITGIEERIFEKELDLFKKSFRYLDFITLYLLAEFFIKPTLSIHHINRIMGHNEEVARNSLNKLMKIGLIEKVSRFKYKETGWSKLIPNKIIAMEFKLSRWEEALEQGISNLSFAEYSYVVLDESKVPKTKDIEKYFTEKNVGLLYLNDHGEIKKRYIPIKNSKIDHRQSSYQKVKVIKDLCNKWKWDLI